MKVDTKKPFKGKFKGRRQDRAFSLRKKFCRFCQDKNRTIDYKDVKMLEGFIRERGKIISVRSSGNCARHQRRITEAIKKARFISLLPYVRI
ncbi:MAG: 30S ribosomal protein S18 [Candidatus Omnitrophica bacterium]|nr:30S ribosomal protein S18 [Candidatus Omnitrophota bacterium]